MASLRDIKRRIKSVKNIQQITKAMKMVAAARIRKAEDTFKAAKPYSDTMRRLLIDLVQDIDEDDDFHHPLLDSRKVSKVGFLVVSSDKGLCGSYNHNLLKLVEEELKASEDRGEENVLLTVGAKCSKFMARRKKEVRREWVGWDPSVKMANEIADLLMHMYESGEVDKIAICYSKSVGAMNQEPESVVLLPLKEIVEKVLEEQRSKADQEDEGGEGIIDYVYEPGAEEMFEILIPSYVRNFVYRVLIEARVSELGARLKAMANATDNAEKLADELTLQFFRLRQESITREILEISSGAEALKTAK